MKLKTTDKRRLICTITSGKVDNAVQQLTRELRDVSNIDVSAQTVRHALKEAGLKAATKKKRPRLLSKHIHQRLDLQQSINTGLWKIGSMLFGQMRPRLTVFRIIWT